MDLGVREAKDKIYITSHEVSSSNISVADQLIQLLAVGC